VIVSGNLSLQMGAEDAVHRVEERRCDETITTTHLELAGTAGHRPASVETGILANKEVNTMDMSLTIEDFNALLTSEEDGSPLLAALRKLTATEKPEDITKLAADPLQSWMEWNLA